MNWFAELARRLSMLLRGHQFDADMEEEMRLHLELRVQERIRAGLSPEQARFAARRRFGNPTVLREMSHMAWGWQWFERFLQDVSYGLRAMLRSPGVTVIAILSLALGIGANTAIFSLLDAVMLRSLPVQEPDRLVLFGHGRWVGSIDDLPNRSWDLFSYPFYREISQKNDVFAGVTAINSIEFSGHASVRDLAPAYAEGFDFPLMTKPMHPVEMLKRVFESLQWQPRPGHAERISATRLPLPVSMQTQFCS